MFWGKVLYAAFFICYFHEFVQGAIYDSQAAPYGKKTGKSTRKSNGMPMSRKRYII